MAANVYLYLGLHSRSASRSSSPPAPPASPPSPADRNLAASTGGSPAATLAPPSSGAASAATSESPATKGDEECARIAREAYRTRLRDPAQRQQIREDAAAATRVAIESGDNLPDLHLSEQQLTRLSELSADWDLQAAESDDPQDRDRWAQPNPLIAAELGNEVADSWAKYQRETHGRFEVREAAARIAAAGVPLTAEQRRLMVELYTALDQEAVEEARGLELHSPTNEAEAIERHQGVREQQDRNRDKLVKRAATILSATQLEILRRASDQQAAAQERHWELLRSRGQLVHRGANGCIISYLP